MNPNLTCCNFSRKLMSESESIKLELEKVFGSDVELDLKREPQEQADSKGMTAVVLGVLLALSLVALVTVVTIGVIK